MFNMFQSTEQPMVTEKAEAATPMPFEWEAAEADSAPQEEVCH